jgi:predicted nucleotidyltransferase
VIPSLDGPVLQTLAGTSAPLSLSAVHQLAGLASMSGVRKVLLRLVHAGLVRQVPGGYVLNRDHIAAPAVLELAGLRARLFERIGEWVARWRPLPALVGVFGSAARRDGDQDSDVDVLVVTDDRAGPEATGELAEQVERWTGNQCHVVTVSTADLKRLRRCKEAILSEWERDLVVIFGDRNVLQGAA